MSIFTDRLRGAWLAGFGDRRDPHQADEARQWLRDAHAAARRYFEAQQQGGPRLEGAPPAGNPQPRFADAACACETDRPFLLQTSAGAYGPNGPSGAQPWGAGGRHAPPPGSALGAARSALRGGSSQEVARAL